MMSLGPDNREGPNIAYLDRYAKIFFPALDCLSLGDGIVQ